MIIIKLFFEIVALIKDIFSAFEFIRKSLLSYINLRRPAVKIFGKLLKSKTFIKIYARDLKVIDNTPNNPKLFAFSMDGTLWQHPNIDSVWPEVEVVASQDLIRLFTELKKEEIIVGKMSDQKNWDENIIILGAQADSSLKFYEIMKNVGYKMDEKEIYDNDSKEIIPKEEGYGYGIIMKAKNPYLKNNCDYSFLVGGFGILGTEAASLYFYKNLKELSESFGKKYFSCIIRASISGGKYSVKRLQEYDKCYN
jgi:hypothetical protein